MPGSIPITRFRKLALQRQGLLQARPFGTGKEAVASAIRHLGYVQIDTISVVQRAHHHVLWSRIPGYCSDQLDDLIADQVVFEYWFHAAAYLPMEDFRFSLPRMNGVKSGEKHWFANTSKKLMKQIYRRIEIEGPLMARDFEQVAKQQTGWWDWKPAKQALEQLFIQGDLMVVGRRGFQKRYDIMERALPEGVDTRCPTLSEQAGHLVEVTLRAHGFAVIKSFTYLRKGAALRTAVKERLQQMVDERIVYRAKLPCGSEVYCDPAIRDPSPRSINRVNLLSPFDNCVIQRDRCRSVFDFEYQIECYVPQKKRVYGYFCLPILSGDRFIGRVDCKADRKNSTLNVIALYLQEKCSDRLLSLLVNHLWQYADFNDCQLIAVQKVDPSRYKAELCRLIDQRQ